MKQSDLSFQGLGASFYIAFCQLCIPLAAGNKSFEGFVQEVPTWNLEFSMFINSS